MTARPGIAATALVGATLVGVADALVALATNPDPGLVAYRLGYVTGPLLLGLALAVPACAAAILVGDRERGARVAAAVTAGLWALGIVIDAARAGQSVTAVSALAVGVSIAAAGLASFAYRVSEALGRVAPTRRRLVWGASVAALLAAVMATAPTGAAAFRAGTGPCARPPASADRPNLILITIDSLRLDSARRMSSYRRLAARGVEFLQHVTPSPWTLPSVASLLTGLPIPEHGAGRARSWNSLLDRTPIRAGARTIAHALGERGWTTHAVVTNPFLTARYGVDEGFCTFENVTMEGEAIRALERTTALRLVRALAPTVLPSDRGDHVVARARRWIAAHSSAPFFLWVHLLDPHAPYGDRDGASTSLTLDLMALQGEPSLEGPFAAIGRLRAGELRPGSRERARIRALYEADVAHADGALHALLDELDARGLAARTAIVFTADHGEEFWEHGGVEHGRTLYEEVLRVPLVVVVPGGAAPRSVQTLTTAIDVAPTILALASLDPGTDWPGHDLTAALPAASESLALGGLLFGEEWDGIRTPSGKYMRAAHGVERMYDLAVDPGELTDTAATKDLAPWQAAVSH